MLNRVTDKVRVLVNGVLSSTTGDQYKPVKVVRELLGTANDLVGRPFCTEEELAARRGSVATAAAPAPAAEKREPAPVMLYFDGKDHRTKKKMEELLRGRDIPFTLLDVTDDEATRLWATSQAHQAEFPLLFIAGESIGGLHELTQLDVNGTLKKKVFG
jgi:glutaredoxin